MNFRHVWLIGLMVLATAVSGCASNRLGAFNPALLPQASTAVENRTPGRVALLVPVAVQENIHLGSFSGIHSGRIVEEAMFAAMNDALRDGTQRMNQPPAAGSGFAATLSIDAVRIVHDFRFTWLSLLTQETEVSAQLLFDLRLFDAQGRTVWSHSYDSGLEVYRRPSFWSSEHVSRGVVRMAHEQAWRLSQQAMADLRDWLETERNKARQL